MNKRESSFPYDWLAPGEIRYCYCGWRLVPLTENMCKRCKPEKPSFLTKWFFFLRKLYPVSKTDKEHKALWNKALKLARKRKDQGIKPLFWIKS